MSDVIMPEAIDDDMLAAALHAEDQARGLTPLKDLQKYPFRQRNEVRRAYASFYQTLRERQANEETDNAKG